VFEKRGLLVDPASLPKWGSSHAALPTTETTGDAGSRQLYFSVRDAQNRASVARAPLRLEDGCAEIGEVAAEPALSLGELGAFDDSGVTTSWIVDRGGDTYLYYTGWTRGVSVPFYFYAGLAVSTDGGQTFGRVSPAPLLERSSVDPYLTASPCVLVEGGVWRMWYVSCTGWTHANGELTHHYHIRYAESDDGVRWRRDGLVAIDFRDAREYAIARPCVLKEAGRYRMWFSARGDAYRLGYAESDDGLTWDRRDEEAGLEPSSDGWDAEMVAYPLVFRSGGTRYMLYNGNGYGKTGIGYAVERGGE
jgi:hypothetical protein